MLYLCLVACCTQNSLMCLSLFTLHAMRCQKVKFEISSDLASPTCPCPLPTTTSIREMSSRHTLDLDDYLWIAVFEAVLEPKDPSQEVLPLLYVCKRWKVQFSTHAAAFAASAGLRKR
jgi:hypothetical protein